MRILILLLFLTACGSDESIPPEFTNIDSIRQTMPASKMSRIKTHYVKQDGKLYSQEHEFELGVGEIKVDGFALKVSSITGVTYNCYFTGPLGAIYFHEILFEDGVVRFQGKYYYVNMPGTTIQKTTHQKDTIEYVVRPTDNISKVATYLKVPQKSVIEANNGSQILHRGKKLIIKNE